MQVVSLQAQAAEHRMIKEKLQAAVTAALGDASSDASSLHQQPIGNNLQREGCSADMGSDCVVDLQNAISELQVCSLMLMLTSLVTLLCHRFCMLWCLPIYAASNPQDRTLQ